VIVSHNHRRLIERCLPSIFGASISVTFEIALIDNTGRDGVAEWVSENFPQVNIIKNRAERSFAENINTAIRILRKGRYFVLCNPDIECLPGLWDEAIRFMDDNPDVGIMGPQLLNRDLTLQPSCRRFSTPLTLLIRGLHLDGILKDFKPIHQYLMLDFDHKTVMDVDWVTGALMVVRRDAIVQIGGMDERYRVAYSEDQDWCCRMWRGGWRVCYVPMARAIHDHQRTGMQNPLSRMGFIQFINAIRMFRKFDWRLSRS